MRRLGSTVGMVNSNGQIQISMGYSSFGMPSQSGTTYYFPWPFAGVEWSDIGNVSQQYYAGARYYSPGLRRFISPDPMGFAGSGSNLFAYAGNDPVNNTDPTGLMYGSDTFGDAGYGLSAIAGPGEYGGGGYVGPNPPPQPGQGWGGQWPVQPFAGPPTSIAGTLMAAQSIQDGATPTRDFYTPAQPSSGFKTGGARAGSGYFDVNVSVGFLAGVTGGLQIDRQGRLYPYIGGGVVTPGVSGSLTFSASNPSRGWQAGLQFTLVGAVQYGLSLETGERFSEYGIGGPIGASLTEYYVFGPFAP